jgi:predicted TIM-barrel fold metal-dependent hydrolase
MRKVFAKTRSRAIHAAQFLSMVLAISSAHGAQPHATHKAALPKGPFTEAERQQFVALDPIDTHTHIFHPSPAFTAMLNRLNLHIIDILVIDNHGNNKASASLPLQRAAALKVIEPNQDRMKLCTTFDPFQFNDPGFADHAIAQINSDFAHGAIAVKIWKNVGMQLKNGQGKYVLPDDPRLQPIYKDIAEHHATLIAHLADPDTLWAPPDPKADDYSFYMQEEPWWYMYGKQGVNAKETILKARDHILEMNPTLRVVGAHLGSLEASFQALGEHFDRYPNFAVDTAGRIPYFEMLPREQAIAFITKYQDRLIYATDNDKEFFPPANSRQAEKFWENAYAHQWRYLATNDTVTYQGKPVQGLALPMPILRKLYRDNALKWFPGLSAVTH